VGDDLPCAPQRQARHSEGDYHVGPAGLRGENAARREQDGYVPDDIVAAAKPHRAHVAVAAPEGDQKRQDGHVGEKRHDTDHSHDLGPRYRAVQRLVGGLSEHPQAEQPHGRALDQGRGRARAQCGRDDEQADGVVGRVSEEVQRVCLQRA
jgi:hypothetical protein